MNLTILSPIYNCELFIKKAYKNILNQNYPSFEWLIINDGSNDNSHLIIEDLARIDKRISYFKLPRNMGRGYARNFGLMLCKNDVIVNWDIDDIYNKKRLITVKNFFSKTTYDYCWDQVNIVDKDNNIKGQLSHAGKFFLKFPLHNTLSFKKSIGLKHLYQMIGTTGGIGEDHYFLLALKALHRGKKLNIRSNYFFTRERFSLKSYHSALGELLAIFRVLLNINVCLNFKLQLFFVLLPICILKIVYYQFLLILKK